MPASYGGWPISQSAQEYADAWTNGGQPLIDGQWQVNNLRLTSAGDAMKRENQALMRQYADLFQNDQRNQAMRRRNAYMGTSHQNDLSALFDASVLANDNFQVQNGGAFGFAAGNQANATLDDMEGRGTYIDPRLRQAAADQDYLWNLDGDTTGLKGVGSLKYNSMGIAGGSYTGNNSTSAYGANAFNDNGTWNQNSGANYFEPGNTYDVRQMLRAPGNIKGAPMGIYGGPQGSGQYVRQYGDPRQNTGNNNNYQWQPPFLTPKPGFGDINTTIGMGTGNYAPDPVPGLMTPGGEKPPNLSKSNPRPGSLLPAPAPNVNDMRGVTMYGLGPAASIAEPPQVKRSPSPIKGAGFSEMNPSFDAFSQDLFINSRPGPSSGTFGDSAFSRYQTDPFTAGQVDARMSNYKLR